MRTLFTRFLGMFRSNASRLDEEIESHIAMQAAEFERSGMSPREAYERAARAFGHTTRIREQHREQSRLPVLDSLVQDIRYALRQWRVNRVFAFTAITTLAVGIGAATSIFQLLDTIVLRSLPVRDPEQLVTVIGRVRVGAEDQTMGFSYPQFVELGKRQTTTAGVFASAKLFPIKEFEVAGNHPADPQIQAASANYFPLIGTTPQLGRLLTDQDNTPGEPLTTVISDALWRRQFQGSPNALGRTILVNGFTFTIVGVTRPEFFGELLGAAIDAWIPMGRVKEIAPPLATPNTIWLTPMARLRPDVTQEKAEAELSSVWNGLGAYAFSMTDAGRRTAILVPSSRGMRSTAEPFERPLWLLMGAVALLLLIGCANLANLLLARATARTHEIGIRLAIGAGRARVVRQLLTESMLLALIGGVAGLLLAAAASQALLQLAMSGQRWYLPTGIDWRIAGFAILTSAGAVLIFGLIPAFASTQIGLPIALSSGGRTHSRGRFNIFATRGFVVAQLALSVLLVAGSALLIRSFWNLAHQDFGYQVEGVLSASISGRTNDTRDIFNPELQLRIAERLRQIPGVFGGGLSITGLLDEGLVIGGTSISTEDRVIPPSAKIRMISVSPGYMEAMGIPLLRGRAVMPTDRKDAPNVAVISESAARAIFGTQDPIGRHVYPSKEFRANRSYTIVGVMRDIRYATPREDFGPMIFAPIGQMGSASNPTAVIRVPGDPERYVPVLEQAIQEAAPSLMVYKKRTLREAVNMQARRERLLAWLSGGFGVLALVLAAVGLYGVVAYAAEQRTSEMGIRLALGASSSHVRGLLLGDVLWMLATGLAIGGIAILGFGRLMNSLLFGLTSNDPLTLAVAFVVLSSVALIAAYVPARRVSAIDPSLTLRRES